MEMTLTLFASNSSIRSLKGTIHHLTLHNVKQDGKYRFYSIPNKSGSVLDQLTHQVNINRNTVDFYMYVDYNVSFSYPWQQ